MLRRLIQTENCLSSFVLRVLLGVVMLPHGCQKVLGWFGGHGLGATMNMFTVKMGIPWPFAVLAITAEFLGSLGLIVGLLTRVAGLGIASVMAVAVLTVHLHQGFFMNWSGTKHGEGFEYHLLALAIAVALMIKGGGRWSIDRAIIGRLPDIRERT